jgi:hypothetical protein
VTGALAGIAAVADALTIKVPVRNIRYAGWLTRGVTVAGRRSPDEIVREIRDREQPSGDAQRLTW